VALFSVTVCILCFLSPVIDRLAQVASTSALYSGQCGARSRPGDKLSWPWYLCVPPCTFPGTAPPIRPPPLPSTYFPIHYSPPTTTRRYTVQVYWHCDSSFPSNRPAVSGFQLHRQFENDTSSPFRLVAANKMQFISKSHANLKMVTHLTVYC
jgi:hypothetical protein